jgi:hypothetical protein
MYILITDIPDAPAGKPTVSEITIETCRLDWQVPANNGGAEIMSYTVEKCEIPDGQLGCSDGKWERVGSTQLTHMQIHRLRDNKQYR